MAVNSGPKIVRTGLVAFYDPGSEKSFRGISATNLMYGINNSYSPANDGTLFKTSYGTESVFIPYFNQNINVKYVDIYNDYNGGSTLCCPVPFSYHSSLIAVSGNTTYMYQIIYKTDTGYYHTNYMYRYEYNSSSAYITEGGVLNVSRTESLGDGWIHAWGSFTTNANTTSLQGFLFHYEYNTWNRIRVAAVSLTQGSLVHRPEHLINLDFRASRGNTTGSGGGLKDLIGSNDAELINGVSHNGSFGGSLVFDGVNDYVLVATGNKGPLSSIGTSDFTLSCWATNTGTANFRWMISNWATTGIHMGINFTNNWFGGYFGDTSELSSDYSVPTDNSWHFYCVTRTSGTIRFYVDGSERTMVSGTSTGHSGSVGSSIDTRIGIRGDAISQPWIGNISSFYFHNRTLSTTEILNLYKSTRSKFTQSTNRNIITSRTSVAPTSTNSLFASTILYIDPSNRQSYSPGSQIIYDLSSSKRTGIMYTNGGASHYLVAHSAIPLSTDGKGSLQFDGVNDWIRLTSSLYLFSDATVSAWIKISVSGSKGIISHCSGGPVSVEYSIQTNMSYRYWSGPSNTIYSYVAVNDGLWKNVVWVKTGTNMKMYVNGILDREFTLVSNPTAHLRAIGTNYGPCQSNNGIPGTVAYGPGTDYYSSVFNGLMGPLKVWSRALVGSEVTQLWNNFRSRFSLNNIVTSGLVLHLSAFDRTSYPGSGTTWTDLSGLGNNGAFSNGPSFSTTSGGGIVRDSTDDYIELGITASATKYSVEFWFKANPGSGYRSIISAWNSGAGGAGSWELQFSTGVLGVHPNYTISYIANTIIHVVYTQNVNETKIYINEILRQTSTTSGVDLRNGKIGVGNLSAAGYPSYNLDGTFYSIRIYNKILSPTEISQNFNAERWRFGI